MFSTLYNRAFYQRAKTMIFSLAVAGILSAADKPTIIGVAAKGTPSAGRSIEITITGTNFAVSPTNAAPAQDLSLNFIPAGSATVKSLKLDDKGIEATVKIASNVSQTIQVTVRANNLTSDPYAWDTGIAVNDCLEATKVGGCQLRWEVDATGITGSGTQTNSSTSPNVMVKLDWQIAKNKDSQLPRLDSKGILRTKTTAKPGAQGWDRFGLHLVFKAGYAPVSVSTQLQQISSASGVSGSNNANIPSTSGASSAPCTTSTTSSSTPATTPPCTAATTEQAFIGEAGGHLGWAFAEDGAGTFAEFGFAARGSLQGLVSSNQLFQNGNINYQALANVNAQDAIKLGEITARFRLASHDGPASTTTGAYPNTSDILLIEGGYQYNSGLDQLAGSPTNNTKQRLVARFFLFPELPNSNHTRFPIGIEYSGGIHGGPRILQFVYGTNLNLGKLFGSNSSQ